MELAALVSDPSESSKERRLELHESDLECSVCQDLFKDPKLLPCAHVVCRHCLLAWLSTNHDDTCPLCRCDITEGKKKVVLEEMVSELPDDVAMAALVKNARLLRADHVCVGCRQCQAVSVCVDCGDMLCEACTTTHRNLTATKYHKVESLSEMTATKLSRSQPASCCVHSDRPSELFCPTHGAAICHLCASSVHRACPEVKLFEMRLQEVNKELTAVAGSLKTTDKDLEKALEGLDGKLKEAEKQANQTLTGIEEACTRLQNAVEACRQRLRDKTVKAQQTVEESAKNGIADLLKRRGKISSHIRLVDRIQMTSPPGKLEQALNAIKTVVANIDVNVNSDISAAILSQANVDLQAVLFLEKGLTMLGESRSFSEIFKVIWRFLDAPNISVSGGGSIAERLIGNNGIVFSDKPMDTGLLYEVVINKIQGASLPFPCGAVSTHPAGLLNNLPQTAVNGWKAAIVFSRHIFVYGVQKDVGLDSKFLHLKEGARVGLLLDAGGNLHLFINGQKQRTVSVDPTHRFYTFFDLFNSYKKITCLPATEIH